MNHHIWRGNKVRLRPLQSVDWSKFHANDSDSETARLYSMLQLPRSEEATRSWLDQQMSRGSLGDNVTLAVETLDGELAGSITAHGCDKRFGTFNYGIAIFREHWRKGYAAEAVALLLRYYFEELRYQKANAHVYAFNTGSIAFQERLGFVLEGRLRNMIYTNGQHFDELIYGMVKEEFVELAAARLQ